jgi:hypothetical protein
MRVTAALADASIARVDGTPIRKRICVKGKILNLVAGQVLYWPGNPRRRGVVKTLRSLASAAVVAVLAASSLWAHHSITAVFDTSKQVKIVGELTDVDWVNPHIFLHLKVKNAAGAVVPWKVEGSPPAWYRRAGASSNTFSKRIGETVTIDAQPAKDGSNYSYLLKITFANGDSLEGATAAEAAGAQR